MYIVRECGREFMLSIYMQINNGHNKCEFSYGALQRRMDLTISSKMLGDRKIRPKHLFFASGCIWWNCFTSLSSLSDILSIRATCAYQIHVRFYPFDHKFIYTERTKDNEQVCTSITCWSFGEMYSVSWRRTWMAFSLSGCEMEVRIEV